jgi:hypothetical protein
VKLISDFGRHFKPQTLEFFTISVLRVHCVPLSAADTTQKIATFLSRTAADLEAQWEELKSRTTTTFGTSLRSSKAGWIRGRVSPLAKHMMLVTYHSCSSWWG